MRFTALAALRQKEEAHALTQDAVAKVLTNAQDTTNACADIIAIHTNEISKRSNVSSLQTDICQTDILSLQRARFSPMRNDVLVIFCYLCHAMVFCLLVSFAASSQVKPLA